MLKSKSPKATKEGTWPALGNSAVIYFLEKSLASGQIAQAYIFAGPEDIGKATIAIAFARRLLAGDKPAPPELWKHLDGDKISSASLSGDLHILEAAEGQKNIGIEAVRDFIRSLNLSSFLNSYQVGIIRQADRLSLEAANALLKTLEEPKDKVVVILTVSDPDTLPATLVSRSQVLYFRLVSPDQIYDYLIKEYGCDRVQARDLANLALGRPLRASKFLADPDSYEAYQKQVRVFIQSFSQDLNARLAALKDIWSGRLSGPEASRQASEILEIWQSLARDLILLDLGLPELVQNSGELEALRALNRQLSDSDAASSASRSFWLDRLADLSQGQSYLAANVSPLNVLENILINI